MIESIKNSKQRGDVGVSVAIMYFQMKGIPVLIPFGDSQRYDLVVDIDGRLLRVQVKTSTFQRRGSFEVAVKTCGGNRSGQSVRKLDKSEYDILFIYTSDGCFYEIPADEVGGSTNLALGKKYDKFKGRLDMSESTRL